MPWQTRLTNCTYKGVILNLSSDIEIESGKKGSVFDYPNIDGGSAQDLGNEQRRISVSCFVSGDNYDNERNILESVLREEGTGTLQHPTMGTFNVLPISWKISESPEKKGGICNFSISFVEILTPLTPQIISSAGDDISSTIDDIIENQATRMATVDTSQVTNPVALTKEEINKIKKEISSLSQGISSVYNEVTTVLDATINTLISDDLTTLVYSINNISELPEQSILKAGVVLNFYKSTFESLSNSVNIFADDETHFYNANLIESIENTNLVQASSAINKISYKTRDEIIKTIDDYKNMVFSVFENQQKRESESTNQERKKPYKVSAELSSKIINLLRLTVQSMYDKAIELKPTKIEKLSKDITLLRFCYEKNIEPDKFLELNSSLIDIELLEEGTEVIYD